MPTPRSLFPPPPTTVWSTLLATLLPLRKGCPKSVQTVETTSFSRQVRLGQRCWFSQGLHTLFSACYPPCFSSPRRNLVHLRCGRPLRRFLLRATSRSLFSGSNLPLSCSEEGVDLRLVGERARTLITLCAEISVPDSLSARQEKRKV